MFQIKSGISKGVHKKIMWNIHGSWFLTSWSFHQGVSHNFSEFAGVKVHMFSKSKVTHLKVPGFFSEKYIYPQPLLHPLFGDFLE